MSLNTVSTKSTSSLEQIETQLVATEATFHRRWSALAPRLAALGDAPNVAPFFAEAEEARRAAISVREQALHKAESLFAEAERRLKSVETELQRAKAEKQREERENRKALADGVRVKVATELDPYSDVRLFTGFSGLVDDGGVFVPTYANVQPGTAIELFLKMPDGSTLQAVGEVRWVREAGDDSAAGLGVALQSIDADDLATLRAFTQDRDPLFFPD